MYRKIIAMVFFFAFTNLFFGAAWAVPVPAFESGRHVYVVYTMDGYRLPSAIKAGLSQLETQLQSLHYPDYLVVYAPGYRTVDMPFVKREVLAAWTTAGYNQKLGTLEILMLAPVWVEVQMPSDFQPAKGKDYTALLRAAGTNFTRLFVLLQEIEQAMSAADKEVQRQKQTLADVQTLAEVRVKAEHDQISVRLEKARKYFLQKTFVLGVLVGEVKNCCSEDMAAVRTLLAWTPSSDFGEVYEYAADMDDLARQLAMKIERHDTRMRNLILFAFGGAAFFLALILLLVSVLSRVKGFEVRLQTAIDLVGPKIYTFQGFIELTQSKTQALREQCEVLLQNAQVLQGEVRQYLGVVFVWPTTYLRLRRKTKVLFDEIVALLQSDILLQIQEIQGEPLAISSPLRLVKGFDLQDPLYRDVLRSYESFFETGYSKGLDTVLVKNPLVYPDEVRRRQVQLNNLQRLFEEFAQRLQNISTLSKVLSR